MAETRCCKIRLRKFDVHKVPSPRRVVADLGRVSVAVPIFVRPCRLPRDVVAGERVGIRREQRSHLRADGRVEIVFGDQSDDLVTFVAPGGRSMRVDQRYSEQSQEKRCMAGPYGPLVRSGAVSFSQGSAGLNSGMPTARRSPEALQGHQSEPPDLAAGSATT